MLSRNYILISACFVVLRSQGVTALRLEADASPSCRIVDFFEFDGPQAPKGRSIRNYTLSEFYGPVQGATNKNWAPSAWAFRSTFKSQKETFAWKATSNSGVFNQYLIEQVMLSKWQDSGKCCTVEQGTCVGNEDIVVVPSYLQHWHEENGYLWHVLWEKKHGPKIYSYWNAIYERHYKPAVRKPLIVLHMSYTWHLEITIEILKTLTREFPKDFVNNVVIGGQEADIQWRDHAKLHHGLPLLYSLPYPVGITSAVSFTSRDGSGFDPNRDRPITITFEGDWVRPQDGGEQLVRRYLRDSLKTYTGITNSGVHICRDAHAKTDDEHVCGIEMDEGFDTALNSVFCLEPPGDTLTRSHLYVAVLTGCIPVIFDGGHNLYGGQHDTSWAWRKTQESNVSQSVDYNSFAVVYKFNEMASVNWVQELIDMPAKQPDRLLELRRGLDNVRPLMRYSPERNARDAFDAFFRELNDIRLSRQ